LNDYSLYVYYHHMHGILQFNVSCEDGAYTADGVNAPIVTFGYTFEELQQNIREAVTLFFEGEEPAALGFVQSPSILTSFELPTISYGGKA
jgi:hypothetical protein